MILSMQIFESIQEIVAAVAQEIFALVVFAASFYFWRHLHTRFRRHGLNLKCSRTLPQEKSKLYGDHFPKCKQVELNHNSRDEHTWKAVTRKRVKEGETEIMRLLQLREFTSALNLFRTFEREGLDRHFASESMYSGFIQSAIRVGKTDVVERMLKLMSRNQIRPKIEFWHTTLKMLSSRKNFSTCMHIYALYSNFLPNDKIIFSCLMNAALESGAHDQAVAMLGRFKECDLELGDYVTFFRTYVAADKVDQAVKLFKTLREDAVPLMLNLVLLACINAKQPERALELLSEAHSYEDLPSRRVVDAISYNTVIKGFAAAGSLKKCFDCLRCMQERSLEPDDVTLTSFLEICLAEKQKAMTDHIVNLLIQPGRPLDTSTCNLFIKGLIRVNRLPKAMEIYAALKASADHSSGPTVVTYSMLIKALVDAHDMEQALLIIRDMALAGDAPDEIIFTHLLEGCRLVGNHQLGERLFQDMLASNVRPSEYTLTMMVKLHGRCGALDKAYHMVATWEAEHAQKPSVIHYTCLVSGCLRSKQYDRAWEAYELMEKHGVAPDSTLMKTLVPAMLTAKKYGCVLHLVQHVLQKIGRIPLSTEMLDSILSQMMESPEAKTEAEQLRLLIKPNLQVVRSKA